MSAPVASVTTPPSFLRRAGAVVAALLAVIIGTTFVDIVLHAAHVFAPWGQPISDPLYLLATAYRIVFGVAGGYIAARLAPDKPMAHALALGAVAFLLSVAGAVVAWNAGPSLGPLWYPLGLVAIAMPTAWAGGKIAVGRRLG